MIEVVTKHALPIELSLAQVKSFVRVYDDEHDQTLALLVDAAVDFIERYTRQAFRSVTYRQLSEKLPMQFARFPVQSVDSLSWQDAEFEWHTLNDVYEDVFEDVYGSVYSPELSHYYIDQSVTPPTVTTKPIDGAIRYRWQYTAGYENWPSDVILLALQVTEENFVNRGATPATAQAIRFSRAHQLALDQYSTHHDAIKWV